MASPKAIAFLSEALQLVEWGGPVFDLCAGEESEYYRPEFEGKEYKTLDKNRDLKKVVDIVDDVMAMPGVASESVGVALLMESLEHVENPFKAFREIARVLKPGGILVCTTVACFPLHAHPKDLWRFLPDGLRFLCKETGLVPFHEYVAPTGPGSKCECQIAAKKG